MSKRKQHITTKYAMLAILFALLSCTQACRKINLDDDTVMDTEDYSDWNDTTHGNLVAPDYNTVFAQHTALRFDIKISADDWASMQSDLASNIGSSGQGGGMGVGPGGAGGVAITSNYVPVWVHCSLWFNGIKWYHVGIRFKGNSSLMSAYKSGNNKLSFKLDFDQFEDDYPAITNQRFYGFKQLNLKNNFDDVSMMREKVGDDLFHEFGLPSPRAAFCVLYVDYGEGPKYYGVYTLVEEVDDSMLASQFNDGSGNLYKPEGDAATFANGTYNTSQMYIKTNESSSDYSDVRALYDAVNSSLRTTDTAAWKQKLESVLDVDGFLKWLAANTVMQDWDTYGLMPHNYYLYNNPENGLLTWIPWDNNEAFQEGKMGGALSLSLSEVTDSWPLIRYLIDIPEYKSQYKQYLAKFINEVFVPDDMAVLYQKYYDLLVDDAYHEEAGCSFLQSPSDFDNAVSTLKTHVQNRTDAVNSFLTSGN
jgi:spore coat protein H